MTLQDAVIHFGANSPAALAVRGPDAELTYSQLDALSNRIARALAGRGVTKGDRVALWLDKSCFAIASMQAVLRLGAAYVPADPLSPPSRIYEILSDCAVAALITTSARISVLEEPPSGVSTLCLDTDRAYILSLPDGDIPDPNVRESDLAYVLYTSGSSGKPKGVCVSHSNALAFTCWGVDELGVTAADRLSNHAPLHFDLSVFDLYAAFQAGASVSLIRDELSFSPRHLVEFLARERITIWYSVPSVLVMMMEHGGLLNASVPSLRAVLFAGEVFPIAALRTLREHWPEPRFLNLYGPTETNVCTSFEIDKDYRDWDNPAPIGYACSNDAVWVESESGPVSQPGQEGELMVSGPTVMLGYWGRPPQCDRPYATGDIVRVLPDGGYRFVGRRDHLVKVRGHRIELGEIDHALQQHPAVREASVLVSGAGLDARLVAFLAVAPGAALSLLEIKEHCARRLPRYMIVDQVRYVDSLPRTRNGKVDRSALSELLSQSSGGAAHA